MSRISLSIIVCFFGVACGDDPSKSADTGVESSTPVPVGDWCEASLGGEAGERPFVQDFARVHVGQRLFGPTGNWEMADESLVT